MINPAKQRLLPVALIIALIASACAAPAPSVPAPQPPGPAPAATAPAASPTASPQPVSPPASPSPKPAPTSSPAPTATPKPTLLTPVLPTPTPSPKPTPTTTTPPVLTPAPTPVYIYTENFTKPGGWYTTSSAPDKYDCGYPAPGQPPGYYLTLKIPNYALYTLDKTFGDALDFTIQVDCTALTDLQGWYGIAFRMNQQNNDHYEFVVAYLTGTYSLLKTVGGKTTFLIPWTAASLLKKGANQANRLMLEASGNIFTLYANGYLLNRFADA